ncbi:hypothetical protein CEE69_29500 [Rhodopirellula bahusiensis]|uniref:Uncharacterized protein n=1 Tax=Rhodopirellula bahusiensis TaxID=2014065 RepID=A0A2G1VZ67_9BACT|nr:hypothetical protein CEE69_29500 [Rhodopirellula bahusiensis]
MHNRAYQPPSVSSGSLAATLITTRRVSKARPVVRFGHPTSCTSPETKFGERSSDAVQAYARVRAEHGKRRALPSPEFSLNARIPTLPNCVQEGDFNLASTALQHRTTSSE